MSDTMRGPRKKRAVSDQVKTVEATVPEYQGHVDRMENGSIVGWAISTRRPDARIEVRVMVDGALAAAVVADEYRADLKEHGYGDGRHGFAVSLPPRLVDGREHLIEVLPETDREPLTHGRQRAVITAPGAASRVFDPGQAYVLFDANYYSEQAGLQERPLEHYLTVGWRLGYDPHPLFKSQYYLERNDCGGTDPLSHFLSVGLFAAAVTHPLFDVEMYVRQRPDVAAAGLHPLLHYLESGWRERTPVTPFFDDGFYLGQVPGLLEAGFPPLVHYLRYGWKQGSKPHPDFDPLLFGRLAGVPAGAEPLTHLVVSAGQAPVIAPAGPVEVSIIILNLGKPLMTLQCLHVLRARTDLARSEVIVLDNGSQPQAFAQLARHGGGARIIRLGTNRGFGEGNNIASEQARGEFLLFLNNDAFATPGWLEPLVQALRDDPDAGAAGPRFSFPDGRLQEAGGTIAACGAVVQRGRGLDGSFKLFDGHGPQRVAYSSAAGLLVRASSFRRVLGYDMCWDPVYYEDVDLCLKLQLIGQHVVYVPASSVVHVENSTSSDARLDLKLGTIVATNRIKFVSRWGAYLAAQPGFERNLVPARAQAGPPPPSALPRLALYTPFPLTPGGGERYLLSIAEAVRGRYAVTLLLPEIYSYTRLATMARELSLDPQHVRIARADAEPGPYDVFISMGNEVLPPVSPMGRFNVHCCQFPFPLEDQHFAQSWGRYEGYDLRIVYSEFVARRLRNAMGALGLPTRPIEVLSPPVPQVATGEDARAGRPIAILNVGRFTPHGHCKRQDVMIEAFRKLVERTGQRLELHLAGALGADNDSRTYLAALQQSARNLPVTFHLNVVPERIHQLYREASVYWHLTGFGADPESRPELFEHFGITIGEAMSAGCVPVVLRHGGPSEIITEGWDGFLIEDEAALLERTASVLANPARTAAMAERAQARSAEFAPEAFARRVVAMLQAAEVPAATMLAEAAE